MKGLPRQDKRAPAWFLLGVASFLMLPAAARSADLDRAAQLYKLCSACHGERGEGNPDLQAPRIAGLPAWYVRAQLEKFQSGLRGYDPRDTAGLQMRPMARALTRDEDIEAMAAYVAGLDGPPAAPRVEGDAKRGQTLYAPCTACHGPDGAGNEALKAPPLAGQADWYVVEQLRKYREGIRGTQPQDALGMQMRAMSMTLSDEQAMRDVAAYIRSLGPKQ